MIRIFSDSTCDLSDELIKEFGITIIPLHIVLGDKEYKDRIEITPEEIFRWSDENRTTPKTSAVGVDDAIDAMKPVIDAGDEIIVFCISESMSTTGNVLRMAAEEMNAEDRISVIDSANLSTGIGLLVLEAATMAANGMDRGSIVAKIEELKPMVRASFVVDTLTYLHRGGRCSSVAAIAGSALKLHPKIEVKDGAMGAEKKYRGKYDAIILNYVKDMDDMIKNAKKERVFITHSGCDAAIVEKVREHLASMDVFDNIYETRAGGVISSHCGPGTLGVLFISK